MRNAPPKFSKLWTDVPQPSDRIGAYTTEQLEQMNQEFTAAVERAFRSGDESEMAAAATYDLRRDEGDGDDGAWSSSGRPQARRWRSRSREPNIGRRFNSDVSVMTFL